MADEPGAWRQEIYELTQSFTRSMVFGIAFVYTMETWWIGLYLDFWKLIIFFILAFFLNLYLIKLTEDQKKLTFGHLLVKAVRNKGLAVIISAIILYTMALITPFQFPFERDVSTIILLSIPIGIGGDIAHILNIFSQQSQGKQQKADNDQKDQARHPWRFILHDIGSTIAGAVFVNLPISPTRGFLPWRLR